MNELFNLVELDVVSTTEAAANITPILLFPLLAVILIGAVVVFSLFLRNNSRKRNTTNVPGESAKPITPAQEEEALENRDSAEKEPK